MAGPRNNPRAIPGVDTILEAVTDCPLPRPLVIAVIRAEFQSLRKAFHYSSICLVRDYASDVRRGQVMLFQ